MPHRYSSARLFVQAILKHNLVQATAIAFRKYNRSENAQSNPEWEELYPFWSKDKFLDMARYMKYDEPSGKCIQVQVGSNNLSVDSSEEEPDSSSDESIADSQVPLDQLLKDSTFAELEWQLAKKGKLHLSIAGELYCGRSLTAAERGTGLSSAAATLRSWSPRCFRALTQDAQNWWETNATEGHELSAT